MMTITHDEKEKLRARIEHEVTGNVLPWWIAHAVDPENGGFYGAVSNDLRVDNDVPRALVLCARILWTYSAAFRAFGSPEYLEMARRAYDDLDARFYDRQYGGYYWMTDRRAQPVSDRKQMYGQGFVIYGLSEYSLALRAAGDEQGANEALQKARDLLDLLQAHGYDPQYGGYVESCSREWGKQADMRLSDKEPNVVKSMNTMLHLVEPFTNLARAWDAPEARDVLAKALRAFLDHVVDPHTWATRLFFDMDWTPRGHEVSFGHDIEASWLLLEAAEVLGSPELIAETKQVAVNMAEAATKGLDADGSLLYEAAPEGFTVTEKHWWPQAEGMVGFYNAAQVSPSLEQAERFARLSFGLWEYIDAHMVDRVNGDWFKRLTRAGQPYPPEDVKAGPWDCPYHHVRACLEMMRRLREE